MAWPASFAADLIFLSEESWRDADAYGQARNHREQPGSTDALAMQSPLRS
jgi:hypothetical protein